MSSTLKTIASNTTKTAAATAHAATVTITASPVLSADEITKILERNQHLHNEYKNLAIAISIFVVVFALGIAGSILYCYFKIKTKAARMGVSKGRKWFGVAQKVAGRRGEATEMV